jgi:hypothetical protein
MSDNAGMTTGLQYKADQGSVSQIIAENTPYFNEALVNRPMYVVPRRTLGPWAS